MRNDYRKVSFTSLEDLLQYNQVEYDQVIGKARDSN